MQGVRSSSLLGSIEEYLATKEGRRSSTLADLRTRLNRVLVCMDSRPKPSDSRALLKRFAELHFKGMAPGGQGENATLVMPAPS